jgi:hypothetical protein
LTPRQDPVSPRQDSVNVKERSTRLTMWLRQVGPGAFERQGMDKVDLGSGFDEERIDKSAILMMLTYVAAECRRLGVDDAAQHAALAASLLSRPQVGGAAACDPGVLKPGLAPIIPVH